MGDNGYIFWKCDTKVEAARQPVESLSKNMRREKVSSDQTQFLPPLVFSLFPCRNENGAFTVMMIYPKLYYS